MASRALQTESMHFVYNADFIKAFRNNDILIRADIKAPVNVTNFFGLGNSTEFDKDFPNKTYYYRARYNFTNISMYLRRQLQSWMRISVGPSYQSFHLDSTDNIGRYVSSGIPNVNDADIYSKKSFVGGDLRLDINSKNNANIPTRGFMLDMGVRPLIGVSSEANNITQVNMDMRIFMSLATKTRLVLAMRFGWGANYGKYEFPQAMYLGGTDNLRGFRKQRFAGKSMLFNNTELRVRLFDFNTYLFPGSFGVVVFNDIGRVWVEDEKSERWHDGYGFGLWLAPVRRFVVTASFAYSKEESNFPRVTFGFQF
jgi:outer membrane protein assembly factor BamA